MEQDQEEESKTSKAQFEKGRAMRLIDADSLKPSYIVTSSTTNSICHRYVSIEDINSAPTIDAVEVVRCNECKWCECFYHGSSNLSYRCKKLYLTAEAVDNGNGFCSYGERNADSNASNVLEVLERSRR